MASSLHNCLINSCCFLGGNTILHLLVSNFHNYSKRSEKLDLHPIIKYILQKCPELYKTPWPDFHGRGIKVNYSHMTPIKMAVGNWKSEIFEIMWRAINDLNILVEECFVELLMIGLGQSDVLHVVPFTMNEYTVNVLTKYYTCPGNSCILSRRFSFKLTQSFWNIDKYNDDVDGSESTVEEDDEYDSDDHEFVEKQLTILEFALMIKFDHPDMVMNENHSIK